MKLLVVLCVVLCIPGGWSMQPQTGGYPISVQPGNPQQQQQQQQQQQGQQPFQNAPPVTYPNPQPQVYQNPQAQMYQNAQAQMYQNAQAQMYLNPQTQMYQNPGYPYNPNQGMGSSFPNQPQMYGQQYGQQGMYAPSNQFTRQPPYGQYQTPQWGQQMGQSWAQPPYQQNRWNMPSNNWYPQSNVNNPWMQRQQPQRQRSNDFLTNYWLLEGGGNARDMMLLNSMNGGSTPLNPALFFMDLNPVDMWAFNNLAGNTQQGNAFMGQNPQGSTAQNMLPGMNTGGNSGQMSPFLASMVLQ